MTDKKELSRILFRYVFEFMAAGFIGWIYEVITVAILYHKFVNRGMLHMPVCPIYAVGAFILLVLLRKRRNPVFVFVFSAAVTTLFELFVSYLLEFLFHRQFWTYEGWPLSILDRSCVISSAIFGAFAVIYFMVLHPFSGRLSEKLPKAVCIGFSAAAVSAVLVDLAGSVRGML